MSIYAGPEIVNDGLVLHLDAGNSKSYPGSGTLWTDLSGRGNHGTLVNSPTFSNGVMVFDGVNDHVTVADNSTLSFPDNIFTFDYWVKFTSITTIGIVGKMSQWEYAFCSVAPGDIAMYTWNLGGTQVYANSTIRVIVSTETWYNHIYTADGTNSKLYTNSVLTHSNAKNGFTMGDGNQPMIIGAAGDSGGWRYLNGSLPIMKIYNRALTAAEIKQNFSATRSRYEL